ncbi:MFS transporter [Mobiluncus mulieris]|uniref:MFS transporter n=1 Tax=Mobiluncus mulieris TaxID=2052 RepID=A0ABD4TYA8_9ACTO|nr:MFS transporter [Mobiluncus mulieris]MCU9968801.1 MFS transporter [Mobiluncus mulieris]MCU9971260.1 MFS transporter [Mobiluncus mulieris]NMW74614.1 MFS transporter [Mobiluncus mulieris]NMW91099.1 MFS transporter [Mobiluncus mulieris]NMX19334.1 MFS transporter [Mobiluncus mulieris]
MKNSLAYEIWHDQRKMLPPLAVGGAMGGFYATAAGSLIATLSRDLEVSVAQLAPLGSAFGVAMVVAGLVSSWGLRFGPVWFLRLTPLLVVLGTVLVAWSPNVVAALAGVILAALGGTMLSAAAAGTFIGAEGGKNLALTVGVASLVSITTTVLFALVERLFPGQGRLTVWFVMLVVAPTLVMAWRLPAVPFAVFMRGHLDSPASVEKSVPALDSGRASASMAPHESVAKSAAVPSQTEQPSQTELPGQSEQPGRFGQPTRRGHSMLFYCQILRLILQSGVEFAVYAWAVTRFEQLDVSLAAASGLATSFAVGMALGRLGGAGFTHRWMAWYVFLGLGAGGTALAAYVPVVWIAVLGFFISGVGASCLYPISASEFSGMPGIRSHRAAAIIEVLSGFGALGTPVVLGVLLGLVGLQAGFAVLLGFYAVLAVLPRPRP